MTEQSNIAPDHDVEGHPYRWNADAEATEGDDHAEGHAWRRANAEAAEGDDVEGHRLSGSGLDPLDPK